MESSKDEKKTEKRKLFTALGQARRSKQTKVLTETAVKPHGMVIASLLHRLFVERIAFTLIIFCLGLVASLLAIKNSSLIEKIDKKPIYLVPSTISGLTKLDPTMIDRSVVYKFAEEIVHKLGNVSFEDADVRYKELSKHMHPELKARFMREMRPIIKYWKQMKVDQHFNFEAPKKFVRKMEIHEGSKKSVFRVEVWGRTKKYIEGRSTSPYRERITLAFITKSFSADDPWAFRLIEIKRETEQQIQDERTKLAKGKGGKS